MTKAADAAAKLVLPGSRAALTGGRGQRTRAAYQEDAGLYDVRTRAFQNCRDRIVAVVDAHADDVVLDVGCGTGLCFAALRRNLAGGKVIGFDESSAMVELARRRVAASGWDNVEVLHASAATAESPVLADKALFCAVHDILQNPADLAHVLGQLRPNALVVAGGGKFAGALNAALNLQVAALHRPYVRSFTGFAKPWQVLSGFLDDVVVTEFAWGTGFCASGRLRPEWSADRSGEVRRS
ncbi:MAG TPA: class I SAM-dependent methyltransferase [Dermatophilaceae bacterium]|nr:class I SAM-dependent methyltransferase [Dermatophilaceae bacterium]